MKQWNMSYGHGYIFMVYCYIKKKTHHKILYDPALSKYKHIDKS